MQILIHMTEGEEETNMTLTAISHILKYQICGEENSRLIIFKYINISHVSRPIVTYLIKQ